MEDSYSDDDLLDTQHSSLLQNTSVTYGKKFQRIKPPSRNEPSLEISEFHLLSKKKKEKGLVKDLALSLDKTGKHGQVSQKVKKVQQMVKPLPAPLEKPEAEKIKRTVAFDATKTLLNRWEPIVGANRVADHLSFPLNTPFFKMTSAKSFLSNPAGKTPLEKEVESILLSLNGEKKKEENDNTSKKTFFLNRKEIMQQRRELAQLRAQQSYKESKARQQNKIKSKRYHRILRRERTKKQIKEFEELMKTDPEAALKKLEELENTRAEERLTLRHRSTGQWARNRAVHAKYDKQSREMLAQQLRLGKELTQKVRVSDSSDGEDMSDDNEVANDENNPWMQKGSDEYQKFITGYRTFWEDQSGSKTGNKTQGSNSESCVPTVINDESESHTERVNESVNVSPKKVVKHNSVRESFTKFGFIVSDVKEKNVEPKRNSPIKRVNSDWECTIIEESVRGEGAKVRRKKCKKKVSAGGVTKKPAGKDLDDIFEEMELSLKTKAQEKISSLKTDIETEPVLAGKKRKKCLGPDKEKNNGDETDSQERKVSQIIINETTGNLEASVGDKESITGRPSMDLFSKLTPSSKNNVNLEIDPKKFISIDASKPLNSAIPSIAETGDDDDDLASVDNRISIAAAFTEDDVVTEFQQEKEAIVEGGKPKDLDLTLPGWGEWAGKGVPEVSRRKKKRFLFKVPQHLPRRDDKKDSVIINENSDAKARPHQVNELPFPYIGVESFEASIRAPIGSTWIPETAHEKLITPKVSTLQGAVIEPLTEDVLLDESEMKGVHQDDEFIPEEL